MPRKTKEVIVQKPYEFQLPPGHSRENIPTAGVACVDGTPRYGLESATGITESDVPGQVDPSFSAPLVEAQAGSERVPGLAETSMPKIPENRLYKDLEGTIGTLQRVLQTLIDGADLDAIKITSVGDIYKVATALTGVTRAFSDLQRSQQDWQHLIAFARDELTMQVKDWIGQDEELCRRLQDLVGQAAENRFARSPDVAKRVRSVSFSVGE
jgi:hypothetical protein